MQQLIDGCFSHLVYKEYKFLNRSPAFMLDMTLHTRLTQTVRNVSREKQLSSINDHLSTGLQFYEWQNLFKIS